tara:strand:- start:135208 stop:136101 length:894 start_codon:yes stop_codon:yes gene_type:complete
MRILLIFIFSLSLYAKSDFLDVNQSSIQFDFTEKLQVPSSKISENEKDQVLKEIRELEKKQGLILQVLGYESIEPNSINEVMLMALEKMPFSKSEKDKTVLLIIAFKEREIKINYGKEIKLKKDFKNKLVTEVLVPKLKENQLPKAIIQLKNKIARQYKKEKELKAQEINFDINPNEIVKLKEPFENYNYYLPLVIFLLVFPLILKFVKLPHIFMPLLMSLIFGISTYILYPKLEHIILTMVLGLLFGSIKSLNSVLFFLSNSDRGHKYHSSHKRYSLWSNKKDELIAGGVSGDLDD